MKTGDKVRCLRAPKTSARGTVTAVIDDAGTALVVWFIRGEHVATGVHDPRNLEVVA